MLFTPKIMQEFAVYYPEEVINPSYIGKHFT